jgi:glycosyltransferase involved in cell wall biosynthesis
MKISVCLAVYNGEKFLDKQIASILMQIPIESEVIVINDSSSDQSIKIIQDFKDMRVKIYSNTVNLGPQKTFERALNLASGDFIFLSDQDDIWVEGKIEAFLRIFNETNCAAIVSDAKIVDQDGIVKTDSFFSHRGSGPGFIKNFVKNTYLGCCMAFDKRVRDWILPFPKGITQHDEWIGLVCDYVDHVVFLQEKLTLYRRHTANASSARQLPLQIVLNNRINMIWALIQRFPSMIKFRRIETSRRKQ